MTRRRVALLVPGLEEGGGVPAVAFFLARAMRESDRYEPSFFSVPMASAHASSVRLGVPDTWLGGVRVQEDSWSGQTFTRVGAWASELEFQRYRPRRALTRLLEPFDLVQVVAGTPSWALAVQHCRQPVALQVATLTAVERAEALARSSGARGAWMRAMTRMSTALEARALRCVDLAFVENHWMLENLGRRMGAERVVFAPPGVDTQRLSPGAKRAPDAGLILSVGRFADPRKNVRLLFEAYARVVAARAQQPPRLVLAGANAPSADDWRHAEGLGIRERIEMREQVSNEELLALYREASVFALSSDEEGLGVAILEAMACGVPVVSTDSGGPSTSVVDGETGYLVERRDAAAFADRLAALLDDPALRARLGGAARARAVEEFSIAAAGHRFLAGYDRLLADDEAPHSR